VKATTRRRVPCTHTSVHLVAPAHIDNPHDTGEPFLVCRGCGAMRAREHQVRSWPPWSVGLTTWFSSEYDDVRRPYPDGVFLTILAPGPKDPDMALTESWYAFVDRDFGRRLLYGRLRADDVEIAEAAARKVRA